MSKFFIKYNPYTLTTEVELNGKKVADNSILNIKNRRLQEWVVNAPSYLSEECNEDKFEVEFLGTKMDFEDLKESIDKSTEGLEIKLTHIPVYEPKNIEDDLKLIFKELSDGPIEELKNKKLKNAFDRVLNDEFDITVMATMSSGKSTLINALLQKEIMPSSHEATTAKVIEIKDTGSDHFNAEAYSEKGELLRSKKDINMTDVEEFNKHEEISRVNMTGKIPFSDKDETSLVLIDTPGPNNSREESHGTLFERTLSESSKSLVLYILNGAQLGIQDDRELLEKVAKSLQNEDKQSKDRYIFVVNKLDQFRQGRDDVESSLEKIKENLAEYGIYEPHIFPASAWTAFNIRRMLREPKSMYIDEIDETETLIKKFNRNKDLHLEKYAEEYGIKSISNHLVSSDINDAEKALIHTGIPAIEEYISLYIKKYAKTMKIKNLIDIFNENLKSSGVLEKTKQEIHSNTKKHNDIKRKIEAIQSKLLSQEERENFAEEINSLDVTEYIDNGIEYAIDQFNSNVKEIILKKKKPELSLEEAKILNDELKRDINKSYISIKVRLEERTNEIISEAANKLLNDYIDMINNIYNDADTDHLLIDPIELVKVELANTDEIKRIVETHKYEKEIKTGEIEINNPEREGFIGKLKFWKSKYITEDIYKKQGFISYNNLSMDLMAITEEELIKTTTLYKKEVEDKITNLKQSYNLKFIEINEILNVRLEDLKGFTEQSETVENKIKESKKKEKWIAEVEMKLKSMTKLERR